MNQLDLSKVGKAFGFAVPPRVNVNIGGGTGGAGRSGKKRRRDDDGEEREEEWEEIDAVDKVDGDEVDDEDEESGRSVRRNGKNRRTETLGKKRVDKEKYRQGMERKKMKNEGGSQWSR